MEYAQTKVTSILSFLATVYSTPPNFRSSRGFEYEKAHGLVSSVEIDLNQARRRVCVGSNKSGEKRVARANNKNVRGGVNNNLGGNGGGGGLTWKQVVQRMQQSCLTHNLAKGKWEAMAGGEA
ncbi:hypothetical protein VNO78_34136 [Psophocarpus tetragonolobus]|uniref:Uncharacterized protein n=1 Tax=Psophocarpus tetragonolobus TaxID=3891 RepID=A0AAN9P3E8_PSOTE